MEFPQKTPTETVLQEYGISEVLASTENTIQLEGYISSCAHGQGRSTTDRQFFYVNSRPCEPTKVKYHNSVRAVFCCLIGLHMVKFKRLF
jgi:DNA mismatch repair protein PMS2